MVRLPASHHAFMRDGLVFVADRYLVCMACMMFQCSDSVDRFDADRIA